MHQTDHVYPPAVRITHEFRGKSLGQAMHAFNAEFRVESGRNYAFTVGCSPQEAYQLQRVKDVLRMRFHQQVSIAIRFNRQQSEGAVIIAEFKKGDDGRIDRIYEWLSGINPALGRAYLRLFKPDFRIPE